VVFIIPVVDGATEVSDPEHDNEQHRDRERELDNRLAALRPDEM
jgi:hypothetical protein